MHLFCFIVSLCYVVAEFNFDCKFSFAKRGLTHSYFCVHKKMETFTVLDYARYKQKIHTIIHICSPDSVVLFYLQLLNVLLMKVYI